MDDRSSKLLFICSLCLLQSYGNTAAICSYIRWEIIVLYLISVDSDEVQRQDSVHMSEFRDDVSSTYGPTNLSDRI